MSALCKFACSITALFLLTSSAYAQSLSMLTLIGKGTFRFDNMYPRATPYGSMYLNFQQVFGKHLKGEKVVYFIFSANPDFFKFKNSDVNVNDIVSIVEPCNKNSSKFSRIAQILVGGVQDIRGRSDLSAYINKKYLEKSDLIYLPFFLRMRNYVKSSGYYGSEWVEEAVEKNSLCLHISAGTMGGKVLNSETVRLGNLAEFTF